MGITKLSARMIAVLLFITAGLSHGVAGPGWAGPQTAAEPRAGDPKGTIVLPKDPKAVVLSYDPGANGFKRKGPAPYLQILGDGQVIVVNVFDGSKKEGKLTAKELEDLMRFVALDQDFLKLTAAQIDEAIKTEQQATGKFIGLGGVGTSTIAVQVNDKRHEVSYRGAREYLKAYPNAAALARYVAVEQRLSDLGASVAKAK